MHARHKILSFRPADQTGKPIKTPTINQPVDITFRAAASMMHSCIQYSQQDPIKTPGKITLPTHLFTSAASCENLVLKYSGEKRDFIFYSLEDQTHHIMIFPDSSLLLFRTLHDTNRIEVFPVILCIQSIFLLENEKIWTKIEQTNDHVSLGDEAVWQNISKLKISFPNLGRQKYQLFGNGPGPSVLNYARSQFQKDLQAWCSQFNHLPYLHKPQSRLHSNMPHLKAPTGDLNQIPYAWPAADQYCNIDQQTLQKFIEFACDCWIYLKHIRPNQTCDVIFSIHAGYLTPQKTMPAEIHMDHLKSSDQNTNGLVYLMDKLLQSKIAPAQYKSIISQSVNNHTIEPDLLINIHPERNPIIPSNHHIAKCVMKFNHLFPIRVTS